MRKPYIIILISLIFILPTITIGQDKSTADYCDERYYELWYNIKENYNKPAHKSTLEEYLYWIREKGKDKAAVQEAYQELNALYIANPDSKIFQNWMQKYFDLTRYAEESGTMTVNGAAMVHLRHDCNGYSKTIIWKVREKGRPVYTAALEEGFDPYYVITRSKCLINCAIGLLESDRYGFSLYRDRKMEFGYLDDEGFLNMPDYDFVVECERRGAFVRQTEGEPAKELTYAFENAGEIMDECDWWKFEGERQDAEDLLIEYYKDALCKKPPNPEGVGHKFYRELAEQRNLKEAIDFNNGFYGVLYGKVEVEEESNKKPAPGAKVVFESIDEKWETTADENGVYRFEKVIMHKHCSPFHIWAEYEGDRVDDEFKGKLEKPDPDAIDEHNLLIKSTKEFEWHGRITYEVSSNFNCRHGTARVIEENMHREQNADLKLSVDKIEFGLMTLGILGKTEANGTFKAVIDDNREEMGKDYHQIKRTNGNCTQPLSAKNLLISIVGKTEEDPKAMQERMTEMAKNDPMALIKEMNKMQNMGNEEEEKQVEIQLTVLPELSPDITAKITIITNSKDKQESINESIMMPLTPMSIKFDAVLAFHKDGTAELTGGYNNIRQENSGKPSSFGCPPVFVKENVQFMLFKRKAK